MKLTSEVIVKGYTTKELAVLYDVTPRTMRIWINSFTQNIIKKGKYYTALQVLEIFESLGMPGSYTPDKHMNIAS